jgi:DNA-directed DNA polymerase III PolC
VYVPLRVHGWHSLLTGVDAPARLLARAAGLGLEALALTDIDSLGGTTEFLRSATGGVRPLLGAEISDPQGRPGRAVVLVEDERGYRNLCRLVSARQLGDDPGTRGAKLAGPESFDLVAGLLRFQEGLLVLVDHPRLAYALAGRIERERLFVAISPAALEKKRRGAGRVVENGHASGGAPPVPTCAPGEHKVPPPARAAPARELLETARALGLATLAVPDVHCAEERGFEHHRVRTAIKHNALVCDLDPAWLAELPAHLLAPAELAARFAGLPDVPGPLARGKRGRPGALLRTLAVAERCAFVPRLGGVCFPAVELAPGETAYSRLCALAFNGARARYTPLTPEVVRRLDFELSAIEDLGYAPYFLLVKRIADFARARRIPYVGRGSAADSLVAYCLELTDADPLRYKLPFERFLNPLRADRPDIDLDFCWRRRDEVLEHVWEAFGAERTAMIATLNRFGLRAAFREAALAEGVPPVEVNRWSRRLPWHPEVAQDGVGPEVEPEEHDPRGDAPEERAATAAATARLPAALRENPLALSFAATPECRDFPFEDGRIARVLELGAALLDAPRHLGLHPGGVVVAPGSITDLVACQRAAKGVIMTQLDKDGVEAIGLVKMDLLGNRALTVIDDCLAALGDARPELAQLAEDDARTAELLLAGRTLGCFQVESPGMRNLLQEIGARTQDDVIQAVALIRPGPAGSGMKDAFVRRFRGLEAPQAPHPRLSELLRETHGVMLYQEDVMQAVVALAGFSLGEADGLRRALAKHHPAELAELARRFLAGCARAGVEAADAQRVWELVANFSSFGFCKAHAVTYGRIAYRAVYLKAHHPAPYLVAFLNSDTGYYDARVYVEEARRLGVPILPPDVNRSREGFTLEPAGGARAGIRIGLNRVRGLSHTTLATLLEERARRGPFLSLPDFLERTRAHVDEIEHLIHCGAFDAFDRTRPEMLWRLHLLTAPGRRTPRDLATPLDLGALAACRTSPDARARAAPGFPSGWSGPGIGVARLGLGPGESAALFPEPAPPALALPALPDLAPAERGELELEILGLSVGTHPIELFPPPAGAPAAIPCGELGAHVGERVRVRGWLAATRRARTSDGRWMRFLTLEDASGMAEVVVFPDVYERDGHRLASRGVLCVAGRVENPYGACTLQAERIEGRG